MSNESQPRPGTAPGIGLADVQVLQEKLLASEARNDRLVEQVRSLETELAYTRHTLAYRLGAAIVNHLSLKGFWRMPGAVVTAYRQFRQAQQSQAERAVAPPANPTWPRPVARHLLWQAQHLVSEHGITSACEFVEQYGESQHSAGLNLLHSNRDLADDQRWLAGVNAYLQPYNLAPVVLMPGEAQRFYRLATEPLAPVTDGALVSVIMPAFNAEKTLEKAVRSILDQTWQPLELIINDDCSADGTFALAQELATQDPRIKVLRNAVNVGPYVSKNKALQAAKGEFITGHDADDWAHPQRLERQVQAMQQHPRWQVSISYMLRMHESGYFSHFSKMGKTSPDGALRLASISCCFRASFLQRVVGFWDCVRFGADSEMIERCRRVLDEDQFGTLQLVTMFCLDGDNSLTNDPDHGVSKLTGVSPTREYYRKQWTAWHDTLTTEDAFLDFPEVERKFAAPPEALVSEAELAQIMASKVDRNRDP